MMKKSIVCTRKNKGNFCQNCNKKMNLLFGQDFHDEISEEKNIYLDM